METSPIVKVAVSAAPYHIDKPYDYLVPAELRDSAVPGVRVTVPFGRGNKLSEGMILARGEGKKVQGLKALSAVLDREPVLDGDGLALALWMRQRYFCTLSEAIRTILPAGLWYHLQEIWRIQAELDLETVKAAAGGIRRGAEILDALERSGGSAGLEDLREACGDDILPALRALEKAGVVWHETAAKQKVGDKTRRMAELALSAEEALALTEAKKRSSPARYEVVKLLAANGKTACAEITYFTGASARTLREMEKAGLLAFSEAEELRVFLPGNTEPGPPIVLNEEQQTAFERLLGLAEAGRASGALLQGVTGSGKTQEEPLLSWCRKLC